LHANILKVKHAFIAINMVFRDSQISKSNVSIAKKYSLSQLKRDMQILYYFYIEVSARKTAKELNFNYRLVHRKFMHFRKKIAEYCNQ